MLLSLGLRNFHGPAFGNQRLQACTPCELVITNLSAGALNIATGKTKWDVNYQKKIGFITRPAELEPPAKKQFEQLSKGIYRVLGLSGFIRVDYRMAEDGSHLLPRSVRHLQTTHNEDCADSAEHCGFNDKCLLQEIMTFLGDELLSERVMVRSREYGPQPVACRQARKQPWQKTMRQLPGTEHFFRPLRG